MAEDIAKYPERFREMEPLSMADHEVASDELEQYVKQLGFISILLVGQLSESLDR
ncbi:MAG: hypothetical protein K2J92_06990 [Muribaculaceae bacterium]|nr:hypothetical protein [Bacteroides sp.]MDE6681077.1 hypothetical protein [Muribaculaceae bacterium]MDE6804948.1 hypothetical protein [Muribaculaceae bacterium]MDE6843757.1 hypothetical protein [Muribaculaceae bacterium]